MNNQQPLYHEEGIIHPEDMPPPRDFPGVWLCIAVVAFWGGFALGWWV